MTPKRFGTNRGLAIAIGAVALVALAVGVAGAHKQSSKTKTTFTATQAQSPGGPPTNTYKGQLNIPDSNTRCVRQRRVTVTHKGFVLGTTVTSDGGAWTIRHGPPLPPEGDPLVAAVKKRFARNNNKHKHICSPGEATAPAP